MLMQRLQRFSTYGHLKQIVLKMIVDELAVDGGATVSLKVSPQGGVSPNIVAGLQVCPLTVATLCSPNTPMLSVWVNIRSDSLSFSDWAFCGVWECVDQRTSASIPAMHCTGAL